MNRPPSLGALALFGLLSVVACGVGAIEQDAGAGSGGGASDASGGGGSGGEFDPFTTLSTGSASLASICPEAEPAEGASCDAWGQVCVYGDDPRIACRTRLICVAAGPDSTAWYKQKEETCEPLDPTACPLEPDPSSPCLKSGAACGYQSGWICQCTQPNWKCSPPPADGCPPAAPNPGQPCLTDGLNCSYGFCFSDTLAVRACVGGIWQESPVNCGG